MPVRPTATNRPAVPGDGTLSKQLHVLVADDDADVRHFLQFFLTQLGHTVTMAVNGSDLVAQCRAAPPDVVLSDVDMPEMTGIEAVEVIRRFSTVPIVLFSGAWDNVQMARATAAGVAQLLCKPFGPKELAKAIRQALGSRAGDSSADRA